MSFMLLKGMVYHCEDCGKTLAIPFAGGPKDMQIGDFNCYNQYELNKKYKHLTDTLNAHFEEPTLNNSPDIPEGCEISWLPTFPPMWFHVEGCVCESCFKKYGNDAHRQSKIIKQCLKLANQIERQHEKFEKGSSGASKAKIKTYCEEQFPNNDDLNALRKLLHDKDAANPHRRKKIVTRYWTSNEAAFKQRIIKDCGPSGESIQKAQERYSTACTKILGDYEKTYAQWDQKSRYTFEECPMDGQLNLNPYIVTDNTVAELKVEETPTKFYYKSRVELPIPRTIGTPKLKIKEHFSWELCDNSYMQIIRKRLEAAMESLWVIEKTAVA